jgi:hypothetical protein
MRFLIFSIRTLLLRFNHRPGRIFFAVEKITQLETEEINKKKRKIILDCDPGHDDAIAMMMAAKHPAIDLLGITIVAGNQTLDKTLINGLNVCQKLEINVPVYAGMPQPIMRQQIVADNIHGETGLDGPVFEPHYLLIVDRVNNTDTMELKVEARPDFYSDEINKMLALKKKLTARLQSVLGLGVNVKIVEPRSIERSVGKAKRVIDNRKL